MEREHIVKSFDKDLGQIESLLLEMGGIVETQISSAVKALVDRDIELGEQVRAQDKRVDDLEMQIDDLAIRLLALRQPVAEDLRAVVCALKVSANLERIGDYSKNIAKRTTVLASGGDINGSAAALRRMAREVERMLRDALDAYIQRDAELAAEVIDRDEEVDQMYNGLFRELLTFMAEDPRNISSCMHLHFIAKNIEHMGDHVTNIAEQVVYLVTGELPEEARQKQDQTSTNPNLSPSEPA